MTQPPELLTATGPARATRAPPVLRGGARRITEAGEAA
jgi:hypothetical protein